jgi:ATP-dependent Clp protease ATP-binding subunit ClpA
MDNLIPPELLSRLNTLGDFLAANILGQDEVLSDIVSLLQRSFCGMRFPGRPIASMLFLGPTGVGKTETVNLFTQRLFGSEEKLVRLDMSEYVTLDSIASCAARSKASEGFSAITTIVLRGPVLCYLTRSRKRIR